MVAFLFNCLGDVATDQFDQEDLLAVLDDLGVLYYEREAVGDDLLFGEEGPLVFLDVFPLFGVHLGGKGIHVVEDVDQFIELILLEFFEGS